MVMVLGIVLVRAEYERLGNKESCIKLIWYRYTDNLALQGSGAPPSRPLGF